MDDDLKEKYPRLSSMTRNSRVAYYSNMEEVLEEAQDLISQNEGLTLDKLCLVVIENYGDHEIYFEWYGVESDKEYETRLFQMKQREEVRRKQYEELKKEFG